MSNPTLTLAQLKKKRAIKASEVQELDTLIALYEKHAQNGDSPRSPRQKQVTQYTAKPKGLKAALLELTFKAPFTVEDAVKALRAKNRNFDHRQVRDSLSGLVRDEKIRRLKQGSGGEHSLYEMTA